MGIGGSVWLRGGNHWGNTFAKKTAGTGSVRTASSKLDDDMIKTIEIFFKLDLNLSEASKELYVHRNTLIYRLDKIQKYTGYDIRKFNDAALFKIAFFIWRQKNKI